MTTTRHTTGPVLAQIQWDPDNVAPGGFVDLGYSEDGFQLSERSYVSNVHSDRNGGLQGPPIDVQYFGREATLRAKLTDYEITTITRLRQIATKTALADGATVTPGCLLFADNQYFRLLLQGSKDTASLAGTGVQADHLTPLNYHYCIIREVVDITIGAKVAAVELTLTAYEFIDPADSARKLFNRDTVA